ncbi:MAG: glycine/sarcosine/betaine reductase complex component C subunit alpha [Eubacteriales bacterium]|nr:glycine/sarcosine/betaine reductase complex component C subunit alpha [Eubacteriales bacterium]
MMKEIQNTVANTFLELADALESGRFGAVKVAVTGIGSEHGEENVLQGAIMAAKRGVSVYFIGSIDVPENCGVTKVEAHDEDSCFAAMEKLLDSGEAQAAVAMHYPFPIGVATVGRVVCPANGREMFLATTTGTSATDLVEGLVRNAVAGIATAKACGIENPSVGLLNLNGARQAEMVLKELQEKGYEINFAESARSDGGMIMRGNDLLKGSADVMVMDTLTGNAIIKLFAAYSTGGSFETVGYGYGPGVGKGYDRKVLIISRASGAPLIANALIYASDLVNGQLKEKVNAEIAAAEKAGLEGIIAARSKSAQAKDSAEEVVCPPAEPVAEQIAGIDVLDLEDAAKVLWKEKIYAETGMGCTGPIIRISAENLARSRELLAAAGYIEEA